MTAPPTADAHWSESFFTDVYTSADLELRDPATARAMTQCAVSALGLVPGARILDLACGTGRHSVGLAAAGYRVTGVDLVQGYLDRAAERASAAGVTDLELVRADMRDLGPLGDESYDAVVSLHTSFGFFAGAEENLGVLRQARAVLRSGGGLLLDVMNRDWFLRQTPEPFGAQEPGEFTLRNFDASTGRMFLYEERFDPATSRITWTISAAGNGTADPVDEVTADYRVYSLHEVRELLAAAGLTVDAVYGDYDLSPFHVHAPHIIAVARK